MKKIECVIIPARGGSKRIIKKNMQLFCGIPMLERSIDLAKKLSDNVIVSSDDYEILEFATNLGAYPLLRDEDLSNDITPTLPVVIHALLPFIKVDSFDKSLIDSLYLLTQKSNNHISHTYSNSMQYNDNKITLQVVPHSKILCLYATAMFATENIISQSCSMLDENTNASYIVAILESSKVFRSFSLNNEGHLKFLFPQFIDTRSQDLPKSFIDAGQFYLGRASSFLSKIPLLGEKSMGISMQYAHDIDTMLDLSIAESLFTCINKGRV